MLVYRCTMFFFLITEFPVVDYTKTMTAADPGIWTDPRKTVPVEKLQIGGLQGYKDPCNFRYNALNTVDVGSPSPLTFDRSKSMFFNVCSCCSKKAHTGIDQNNGNTCRCRKFCINTAFVHL